MANLRYLILFVVVVLAAVAGVLWQEDDTPIITFTQPETPQDQEGGTQASARDRLAANEITSMVPLTQQQQVEQQKDVLVLPPNEEAASALGRKLTDQELAAQIKLAQEKLAHVEALNARKQAAVDRVIAQEGSAEQSLIEAELAYRIGGWRQAWRQGDVHAYFAYYSDNFTPSNGTTLELWKAQRVKRLNPTEPIDLNLENFEVTFDPQTRRSLVTFKQFYKSGDYQDVTKKRLVMANEQGQWKIVSETTSQ